MNETTKTDAAVIAGSNMLAADLIKLRSKLEKVEKELSKCRTSTIEDGWQTQRHAKKSRKWDILVQEKMILLQKIEELEHKHFIIPDEAYMASDRHQNSL